MGSNGVALEAVNDEFFDPHDGRVVMWLAVEVGVGLRWSLVLRCRKPSPRKEAGER